MNTSNCMPDEEKLQINGQISLGGFRKVLFLSCGEHLCSQVLVNM